ncbi:hypothetical protein PIB30_046988 [Stylosanthes scabra]|uniref:Uncharacterized protein n=1 Tax=Stylosanthes scabra TaxID=79078 RepID=A0ABU6WF35_9FABA|nr:hypothetical protein [Stylosanthes scabra]
MVHGSGPVKSLEMDWSGNRPSIGPIGLVSLSDRLVQLSHVDRRLIRLQVDAVSLLYCAFCWGRDLHPLSGVPRMGSGVIYYEYEKRGKFEDFDMKADAELGTFKIRRYHLDDEASLHPLRSVRIDLDLSV